MVVLVPSATVLWLTNAAVRNERAAIRARLVAACETQLELAESRLNEHWLEVDRQCESMAHEATGAELFRVCVDAGIADSVLIVDDGELNYPRLDVPVMDRLNETAWREAQRLEFVDQSYQVAAEAYAAISRVEPDTGAEAQAWMAHARCLQKQGKIGEAIRVLIGTMNRAELRDAAGIDGRSVWIDSQLRALQLMVESGQDPSRVAAQRRAVRELLEDYTQEFPSAQRLFAMGEFLLMFPEEAQFPTYKAEQLAEQYAAPIRNRSVKSSPHADPMRNPQCVPLENSQVILIFDGDAIARQTLELLQSWQTDDATVAIEFDAAAGSEDTVAAVPIASMPGRCLTMSLNNPKLFSDSSRHQTALYTMASLVTIGVVAVLATFIAVFVRRQLRMAQLKSDLVAIVSHELRTPLASVRVLTETLLDAAPGDPRQRNEYLQLIAQENERLSRLIENFLTFSRMERGGDRFRFQDERLCDLVGSAVAAMGEKLQRTECEFSTHVPDDLPHICADADAVVAVVMNLLDNALKFTGQAKRIELSARSEGQFVTFAVQDDGIGMSPADARRAFDRFYQADTRLSRNHGGCGLGLNLVRSIVEAHGGTVDVRTAVGEGSTFTVRLPSGHVSLVDSTAARSMAATGNTESQAWQNSV